MSGNAAIRPGRLRHPVTIQTLVETRSSRGAVKQTPATFVKCFMEKVDLSGRELYDARQVFAEATTRWKSRYIAGLKPKMRLVDFDGVVYDIVSITDPEGLRREMDILTVVRGA